MTTTSITSSIFLRRSDGWANVSALILTKLLSKNAMLKIILIESVFQSFQFLETTCICFLQIVSRAAITPDALMYCCRLRASLERRCPEIT